VNDLVREHKGFRALPEARFLEKDNSFFAKKPTTIGTKKVIIFLAKD